MLKKSPTFSARSFTLAGEQPLLHDVAAAVAAAAVCGEGRGHGHDDVLFTRIESS